MNGAHSPAALLIFISGVWVPKLCRGFDLAFHSLLVFVDEGAEGLADAWSARRRDWLWDDRAVGEEPHPHSVPLSGGDRALAVPGGQVGREADRWRLGSLWGSRSSSGRVTLSL